VAGGLEILAHFVARARPAVTDVAAAMGQRQHEAANFRGEWMMLPIASGMQP
jgi:hypothetical protein